MIKKFNEMYGLESNDRPSLLSSERIARFRSILHEEIEEGIELEENMKKNDTDGQQKNLEVLTELSDWLGDIIVYCASEARRWGIPLEPVLKIIMESNFSKLDANGQPIYDSRGKVLKGPNYWKPEAKIAEVLRDSIEIDQGKEKGFSRHQGAEMAD